MAGPIPGVSITAPKPLEPGAGSTLVFGGEPPTLLIENSGTSGVRTLWLQVEVGTDAGFQQIVHSADRLTPGEGGRTTYRLPEPLGAGYTYYWRARAQDGANVGPYSAVSSFSVVPPVVIDAPTATAPSGTLTTNKLDFRLTNGAISGTSGVVYRFEISQSASMSPLTALVTATPGSNGTTTMTLGELPYNTTYYWRAFATDGTKQSNYSSTLSFRTPAPPPPPAPPAPTPGPSNGVPLGNGGRTPDPTSGRLPLPNMASVVQAVARANPGALQNSCQDNGGNWQFMDLVVDTLRTYDTRWGYNGKRGNASDPSHDVVAYHYGSGSDQGTANVYIIDIIGGHCGSAPTAGWIDVTAVTANAGSIGRWISRGRF
ncbi:MAG: hypothetical protein CK533_04850 [Acidobacterium sp.]|nr:hypothetical protein [Acidobacteriota bacterium]PHY11289.1 MAG: hypothetical protein CK533_04850 [Acidobacterium sp.]